MAFSEASHQHARLIARYHTTDMADREANHQPTCRIELQKIGMKIEWQRSSKHTFCSSSGQCTCLFYLTRPAAQSSFPQGHRTYLPLSMVDYVLQDQYTCLNQAVLFCNSFMRLADLLQHPCPSNLLLNSRHMCYSCTRPPGMSVTIAL